MWLVNAWTRLALQLLHRIWSSSGKHPRPSASDDNNNPQSWNWRNVGENIWKSELNNVLRYLTFVARNMEAAIQRYNTNRFFFARFRHYRFTTNTAAWCKFSIKKKQKLRKCPSVSMIPSHLLVKIFNAMILISCIDRKWHSIQTFTTYHTTETLWMIWLASGT